MNKTTKWRRYCIVLLKNPLMLFINWQQSTFLVAIHKKAIQRIEIEWNEIKLIKTFNILSDSISWNQFNWITDILMWGEPWTSNTIGSGRECVKILYNFWIKVKAFHFQLAIHTIVLNLKALNFITISHQLYIWDEHNKYYVFITNNNHNKRNIFLFMIFVCFHWWFCSSIYISFKQINI